MKILERLSIRTTPHSTAEDRNYLREKYAPYCKKVTELHLCIYRDSPHYQELLKEAHDKRLEIGRAQPFVEFSKKELDSAEFLVIDPASEILESYGDGSSDLFFEKKCPSCNIYIHQHSDIRVKKKYVGKKDFILSREFQLLVSPRLRNILESEQCKGVEYRPVYADLQDEPVLFQLVITNILLPMHPKMNLEIAETWGNKKIACAECGHTSYISKAGELVIYPESIREVAADFNRSSEYFGIFKIPIPQTIVSQRVRQIFLKHKIKARWEPVVMIEEN